MVYVAKKLTRRLTLIAMVSLLLPSGLVLAQDQEKKEFFYADQDYISIKVNDGDKSLIDMESKNGGAVDWLGYVIELDPSLFESKVDFENQAKGNRALYDQEATNLKVMYAKAKSYFRYLDVWSLAIDYAVEAIFGLEFIDGTTLPDNDSIYLVRAYSGGFGLGGDATEKDFVRRQVKSGQVRDNAALAMNVFAGALDAVSLFLPLDKTFSESDFKEIATAGLSAASQSLGDPDTMQGAAGQKEFLELSARTGKAILSKAGNVLVAKLAGQKGVKEFFGFVGRNLEIAVKVVDVTDKVSHGGQLLARAGQMVFLATPLETAYIVPASVMTELENKRPAEPVVIEWKKIQKDLFSINIPDGWQEGTPIYGSIFNQAYRFAGPSGEYFEVGIDPTPVGLGGSDQVWELTVRSAGDGFTIGSANEINSLMFNTHGDGKLDIIAYAKTNNQNVPLAGHVYYFHFGNTQKETGVDTQIYREIINSLRAISAAPAQAAQSPDNQASPLNGAWSANWQTSDNQSGNSVLTFSHQAGESVFSGNGVQTFNGQLSNFTFTGNLNDTALTMNQYYPDFNDTVTYQGTISGNAASGIWTNTLGSSGTWSMVRN